MFCTKCGGQMDNTARFCPHCGATAAAPQSSLAQPAPQAPQYSAPQYTAPQQTYSAPQQTYYTAPQPTYTAPASAVKPEGELKMGWFKFLIYFALWASAVLNLANAGSILSGAPYEGYAELVYAFYEGLQALDMFVGIACIALAVFAIITRFRLAKFCKNGPSLLTALYAGNILVSVIYLIGVTSIVSSDIDVSSSVISMSFSVLMMGLNAGYFKKRAHLFVN